MFCSNCGAVIPERAAFCPSCGRAVQAAPAATPMTAALAAKPDRLVPYVQAVANRVQEQATWVPELGCYAIVTKRFSAALANMHQYFLITQAEGMDAAGVETYTEACVEWALHNCKGVPRGLQKGIAIYPVVLQQDDTALAAYLESRKPRSHFAAFELPCVVSLGRGTVSHTSARPGWGMAMWDGIKRAAQETLAVVA